MSEHTQGRLVVLNSFLVPVAHADRKIGGSSDPKRDHDEYAHYIADVKGKRDYHDSEANARRLAAAWNVCEGIDTESLETGAILADICERANGYQFELSAANARIAKLEALVAERDAMLGKRSCQNSRCNVLNEAKEIPNKLSYGQGALDYVDGWNACLDAIGKDK